MVNKNREHLRKTFNQRADMYDQIRPSYPQALIEGVITLSGIPEHGRILEIGCGTGKATQLFCLTRVLDGLRRYRP